MRQRARPVEHCFRQGHLPLSSTHLPCHSQTYFQYSSSDLHFHSRFPFHFTIFSVSRRLCSLSVITDFHTFLALLSSHMIFRAHSMVGSKSCCAKFCGTRLILYAVITRHTHTHRQRKRERERERERAARHAGRPRLMPGTQSRRSTLLPATSRKFVNINDDRFCPFSGKCI